MADTASRKVCIVGSENSTEIRKALSSQGRFTWIEERDAGSAEVVLWVVDAEVGAPDGMRDRFRKIFAAGLLRLVVFLAGSEQAPGLRQELISLDARGLLDGLGLDGEAVPVVQGSIAELATVLLETLRSEEAEVILVQDELEEAALTRGGFDRSIFMSVESHSEKRETQDAWIVPVYYGTDRARTGKPAPQDFFGAGRGELSFGMVEVSLPKAREKGEMPVPSWWKPWQRKDDPSRFVLLMTVTPLEKEPFVAGLRQAVTGAAVPEALVFVHGFKVPFAEAAERAAQVALDLEFQGVPLVYSWPSEGKVFDYTVDEANVEWSAPHFEEFLRLVLASSGATRVHVIAHSMGNRALVRALSALQAQSASGGAVLRQIVFAAPDVDRDTFVELAARFQGRAERFTLYGSSNDRALKVSRLFHGYPRAGESGENMALAEGVDTIDSSAADTSLIGHSAYGSKRSILSDISLLLRYGLAPEGRFGFQPRQRSAKKYWVYQP